MKEYLKKNLFDIIVMFFMISIIILNFICFVFKNYDGNLLGFVSFIIVQNLSQYREIVLLRKEIEKSNEKN